MKYLLVFLLFFTNSCSEKTTEFEQFVVTHPNGQIKKIEIHRTKDTDSLTIDRYRNGQIFTYSKRFKVYDYDAEEVFFYYDDGRIMDYKFYVNNKLKFYSRYDREGEILQLNGSPIHFNEFDTMFYSVEPNVSRVIKLPTFTPPKTSLKVWYDGKEDADPYKEITLRPESLDMKIIKDDTLGYLFSVKDSVEKRVCIFWSLEDSISDKILKAGKIVHVYNAKK